MTCNGFCIKNPICNDFLIYSGKYMCPQCWIDEPLLESKATLIVTPVSLKTQWCKEICNHVKGNIKILQYEGASAVSVYPTDLKEYDIVLTTYAVLQNELRLTQNGQVRHLFVLVFFF